VLDAYQIFEPRQCEAEVGEITNTVQVTAEIPLVETATAQKSFVITSSRVTASRPTGATSARCCARCRASPRTLSRNFNLAFNTTMGFNVNGLRDTANNVYLDGTINTDVAPTTASSRR